MRRLLALLLCLLAFGACSEQRVYVIPSEDLPRDLYPRGEQPGGRSRQVRVVVYMVEGNRLVPVRRTGTSRLEQPELVVRALLAGPTESELESGYHTEIPEAVELVSVSVGANGKADVDLTSQSRTQRFATDVLRGEYVLRLAQVVYSLTELEQVDSVEFLDDGKPLTVLDERGRELHEPVGRGRYTRYAPLSVADAPVSDEPLRIDVQGEAEG